MELLKLERLHYEQGDRTHAAPLQQKYVLNVFTSDKSRLGSILAKNILYFKFSQKKTSGLVSLSFTVVKHRKKMHCRQNPARGVPRGGERSIRLKMNLFWCSLRNLFLQPIPQKKLLSVPFNVESRAPITSSPSSHKFLIIKNTK